MDISFYVKRVSCEMKTKVTNKMASDFLIIKREYHQKKFLSKTNKKKKWKKTKKIKTPAPGHAFIK